MVQISDLPQWLSLSSQLIQANPTTTRITTKYSLGRKKRKNKNDKTSEEKKTTGDASAVKRYGSFTIKTHDTLSSSTLVFKTNKAADVGLIMRSMSGLGADLAGVERSKVSNVSTSSVPAAEAVVDVLKEEETGAGASTPVGVENKGGEDGQGKGKKKKKGKSKK